MPAKGSGQFGEDVIVGSPEYWKKWREKNKDRAKLAASKYRLKQKQAMLAMKIAEAEGIDPALALAEVTAKTDAVVQLRSEMVNEGRIDHHKNVPIATSQEDDGMPPTSMMVEEARAFGIPYAEVVQKYRDMRDSKHTSVEVDDDFLSIVVPRVETRNDSKRIRLSDLSNEGEK